MVDLYLVSAIILCMNIKQLPSTRNKVGYTKLAMNVEVDLKNSLVKLAKADGRSMNSYIVRVLTAHVIEAEGG